MKIKTLSLVLLLTITSSSIVLGSCNEHEKQLAGYGSSQQSTSTDQWCPNHCFHCNLSTKIIDAGLGAEYQKQQTLALSVQEKLEIDLKYAEVIQDEEMADYLIRWLYGFADLTRPRSPSFPF